VTTVKPNTIDEYIASFPKEIQKELELIRKTIKHAAPDAEEAISYGMPSFKLHSNLVYFAAFKNHIGLYALPKSNEAFKQELSIYKTGKGSIQFPLDKPMPVDLITKIVKFRVQENLEKMKSKLKKK